VVDALRFPASQRVLLKVTADLGRAAPERAIQPGRDLEAPLAPQEAASRLQQTYDPSDSSVSITE
jgi:hypothetical protein